MNSISTIVIETGSKLYKVDLDAFHNPFGFDLPVNQTHPPGNPIELVGSCYGLLCFTIGDFYGQIVYLWNPATGEYKQLPEHYDDLKPHPLHLALGFGYDYISGKFTVLSERQTGPCKFEATVFTLGTSCWRSIGQLKYPLRMSKSQVFGGCPHWIVHELNSIVSFNVGNDEFKKIPVPPFDDPTMTIARLTSLGGRLSIFSYPLKLKPMRYELWVWMDDGLENTWIKQLLFNMSDIPGDIYRYKHPSGFKNGQVLLQEILIPDGMLVFGGQALFDPVTSEAKTLHLPGLPIPYTVYSYLESFAMLDIEDKGDVHQNS